MREGLIRRVGGIINKVAHKGETKYMLSSGDLTPLPTPLDLSS